MSSGVAVSDECKTYFEDIKKAKKYRYVVFYIKEEKSIVVESVGVIVQTARPEKNYISLSPQVFEYLPLSVFDQPPYVGHQRPVGLLFRSFGPRARSGRKPGLDKSAQLNPVQWSRAR